MIFPLFIYIVDVYYFVIIFYKNMITFITLQNTGLSEIEAKVYICLLEKWILGISKISEYSWCNRVQIYAAIPRLLEKHIIGETIVWRRKHYFAEDPENLENMFEEKKLEFQSTIELLKNSYQTKKAAPQFKTFDSTRWIHYIFNDVIESLNVGDVFYRYSGRKPSSHRDILNNSYRAKRDEKQIERMVITNASLKEQKPEKVEKEVVSIPKRYDLFEDNISKIMYADKVAIIDYNTNTSFIIQNKKFAEFEKKIFKLLFRYLRKN